MSVPRFWREQPVRYNLWGVKCRGCGCIDFPPRSLCIKCKSTELDKYKLEGNGEIVTYTIIRVAPEGFEKQVPYVIAIIKFKEGPRITGQIIDCEPDEVKIGQKVSTVFRKISQDGKSGAIYYGYKFKLV